MTKVTVFDEHPQTSLKCVTPNSNNQFDHQGVIISGIAASLPGQPRFTADLDAVILLNTTHRPSSPQKCHAALAQDPIVENQPGGLICHRLADMQGQQMLFARVAVARRRGFLPFNQALLALSLGIADQCTRRSASLERHRWPDRARRSLATKRRAGCETRIPSRSPGYSCLSTRATLCPGRCARCASRPRSSESWMHGMSAWGYISLSGMNKPWSKPRWSIDARRDVIFTQQGSHPGWLAPDFPGPDK